MARAVTRPTRRPVYGPGPTPTAIALRSPGAAPASAITRAMDGVSSSVCLRRSTFSAAPRRPTPSPGDHSYSATVTAAVAVSKAKTSTD
jgi:hypothetical protein